MLQKNQNNNLKICQNRQNEQKKEQKVIVDESFVLKFEDSTQPPAKRIKQEPTDPEESKAFVDSTTQTDSPIVYACKWCGRHMKVL